MRGLGIDAGAGSISLAVVEDGRLIYSRYALHKGDAKHTLCEMLETMKKELNHTYPGVIEYAAVNRAAAFLFPEAGEMEMADRGDSAFGRSEAVVSGGAEHSGDRRADFLFPDGTGT